MYKVVIGFRSDIESSLDVTTLAQCADTIWQKRLDISYLSCFESVIRPMVQTYSGLHINLDLVSSDIRNNPDGLLRYFKADTALKTNPDATNDWYCQNQFIADNFIRFIFMTSDPTPFRIAEIELKRGCRRG